MPSPRTRKVVRKEQLHKGRNSSVLAISWSFQNTAAQEISVLALTRSLKITVSLWSTLGKRLALGHKYPVRRAHLRSLRLHDFKMWQERSRGVSGNATSQGTQPFHCVPPDTCLSPDQASWGPEKSLPKDRNNRSG